MKLCRFVPKSTPNAAPRYAELVGQGKDATLRVVDGPDVIPLAEARLLVPVEPTKIVGVGLNYRAHAEEMKKKLPEEPLLFLKPPSALCHPGAAIEKPRGYQRVDYEGEVALVMGKRARRVSALHALDYVLGVTVMNDMTVRELQVKDVQYTRAKGFDSFAPCGPCVATWDEGLDARKLHVVTRLNGQIKQDSTTADLIFDLATLVSFISHVMTLETGDVITTGTPPGVGPVNAGDVVSITIDGVGTLENSVVDAPQGDLS